MKGEPPWPKSPGPLEPASANDLPRVVPEADIYRETEERLEPFEQLARIVIMHRARLGLSQQELAERMSTTASVISRIESGRHRVSIETVRKLATAFGIRAGFEYEADDTQQRELVALYEEMRDDAVQGRICERAVAWSRRCRGRRQLKLRIA